MVTTTEHVDGEINDTGDLKRIFAKIRSDVAVTTSRDELTELYRRAGSLVTLTHSPAWEKQFGIELNKLRHLAEEEFTKTAHKINERARAFGADPNYDEKWGS